MDTPKPWALVDMAIEGSLNTCRKYLADATLSDNAEAKSTAKRIKVYEQAREELAVIYETRELSINEIKAITDRIDAELTPTESSGPTIWERLIAGDPV